MKKQPRKKVDIQALRKEVQDVLKSFETNDVSFEAASNEFLKDINHGLRESEEGTKTLEKTLRGSGGPLADRIEKAVADFVGEEEEE